MPSVRVRRGTYSSLRDDVPSGTTPPPRTRPRGHTLANIFSPGDVQITVEPADVAEAEGNAVRVTNDLGSTAPELPMQLRPLRSKVSSHILNRTWKSLSTLKKSDGLPASDRERLVSLEGSQVDVLVRASQHSGRVGSALSIHSNGSGPSRSRATSFNSPHHEDDIVDHLDVIDPQIGAVSTLTNTANAIVMPPLSFLSRKPVVSLPASPARAGDDAEKSPQASDADDLDQHVEDVLTKRQLFKRTMRGVWAFVKTPLGFITAVYGFCVAFWGAAIVIFLVKIINFHNANTQGFWVEVSSQVETGLFTVTGVGLIPFRAMDTYRISRIWYYKRKTRKLRKKAGLPELIDEDDLPDPIYDINYVHVLTDEEQADLHYQQTKFMKSQTWYRPHGTDTHRAFPINTALLICCLIDGNSFFQCILCGTMWGINRFERPAWSTGILIPASFLCGIFSAVYIWHGGKKTRRTQQVEERLRAALAGEYDCNLDSEVASRTNGTTTNRRPLLNRQESAVATSTVDGCDDTPLVTHDKTNGGNTAFEDD